jgi:hypothetical protein
MAVGAAVITFFGERKLATVANFIAAISINGY